MSKKFEGYSYSFTQPYPCFFTNEMKEIIQERKVEEELDALERTDQAIQNMLTFPDAEAILNKIREELKHD